MCIRDREEVPGGFERMGAFYAERARGGAALIVTGGFGPNEAGALLPGAALLTTPAEADRPRVVTAAAVSYPHLVVYKRQFVP